MPPRLFSEPRFWIVALLVAALAGVHALNFGSLVEVSSVARKQPPAVTPASIDEMVSQALETYAFQSYRNVIGDSLFAVNAVKPEPVVVAMPEPEPEPPPPPPPPPRPQPFTANLEVTGIAITPDRKLVMVWDKRRKETHVLREQEKLYQWKVVSIDQQRVVLRHERGGRYEFIVNEDTDAGLQDGYADQGKQLP